MPRGAAFALIALPLILTACSLTPGAAPAAKHSTAPIASGDVLSGAWRIDRSCMRNCGPLGLVTSMSVTELLAARGGNVYQGSGSSDLWLYRIGERVLVHNKLAASLLTIQTPGQLMSGTGVGDRGVTFRTTWHCVSGTHTTKTGTVC